MKQEFYNSARYINYSDGTVYYGNFTQDAEGYAPINTGLYYHPSNKTFVMYENPELKQGLFLKKSESHDVIGHSTYFDDVGDTYDGPCIDFKKDSFIRFSNNKKGVIIDFAIDVESDGSYTIFQYDKNGQPTGKVISFSQGRLYFENRSENISIPANPHNFINVGWAYKASYYNMRLKYFDDALYIRPAWGLYKSNNKKIEFNGFAQSVSSNNEFEYFQNGTVNFKSLRCGYGSHPNSDRHYIGEFDNNDLTGIACIRYRSGSTYVGVTAFGSPNSLGMKWNGKRIEFGEFMKRVKRDTIFTIEDGFIKIAYYHFDKKTGSEYQIKLDTFDVYEYYENRTIHSNVYHFDDVNEIPPLTVDQKIDDMYKNKLSECGFIYEAVEDEITHKPILYVTSFTNQTVKRVSVPSLAAGIRQRTFAGCNKVEEVHLEDGVKYLDEYCFYDCKNLNYIKFGQGITTVNAFMSNSSKIVGLHFPNNITLIKQNAFINCKNLKRVTVSKDCVVETNAFPKDCVIIRQGVKEKVDYKPSEIPKESGNNQGSLFTSIFTKPKKKVKTKSNKPKFSIKGIFSGIGNFFSNLKDKLVDIFENFGDWIKDVFGTIGDAIVRFFSFIGRGVLAGLGFIWDGIKFIGSWILKIILAPFKFVIGIFSSDNILIFIPTLINIVLVVLWLTGLMDYIVKIDFSYGGEYAYDLTTSMLNWVQTWPGLLQLIGYILLAVVAIFDFVVVLLLFKIILPFVLSIVLGLVILVLVYAAPLAAVVYQIVVLAKGDFNRGATTTALLISIACAVYYYIRLFTLM